ncbi:hypothetical protein [Sandarakinorhabdus sp.]|uniref:hypothetical protein n=1 Tax=Sandarakinorhabdus sp. TaxID=1916663 RepID=UPI00286E1A54|nr:hypothetical protein [Sandarakinorhabdus sp.]
MITILALVGILSAAQFAEVAQANGARAAVQQLVEGGDWPRVIRGIGNGAPDWIGLAPELARGSDPVAAHDLGVALARGLPRAPEAVLAVADLRRGQAIGVQIVCSAPFAGQDPAARARYLAEARAAVDALGELAGGKARQVCLKELSLAAGQ